MSGARRATGGGHQLSEPWKPKMAASDAHPDGATGQPPDAPPRRCSGRCPGSSTSTRSSRDAAPPARQAAEHAAGRARRRSRRRWRPLPHKTPSAWPASSKACLHPQLAVEGGAGGVRWPAGRSRRPASSFFMSRRRRLELAFQDGMTPRSKAAWSRLPAAARALWRRCRQPARPAWAGAYVGGLAAGIGRSVRPCRQPSPAGWRRPTLQRCLVHAGPPQEPPSSPPAEAPGGMSCLASGQHRRGPRRAPPLSRWARDTARCPSTNSRDRWH
jgi:hypothetical protein